MSDVGMTRLSVGDRVVDTDDSDPDVGVVVWRPPEKTIADWEFETSEGSLTTAETNPEYPADAQLVLVSFLSDLNGYWEEWTQVDPADLYNGVENNYVHRYGFPEPRLAPADETESEDTASEATTGTTAPDDTSDEVDAGDEHPDPPDELLELGERLESNGATVTTERGGLVIEKLGGEYRVTPSGKVEGDGALAENLASLAAEYVPDTTDDADS